MTTLRRHVIPVAAALFALAIGIALGGGPLSYVSADDDVPSSSGGQEPDAVGAVVDPEPEPTEEPDPPAAGFADAFAAASAARLYDKALRGHPTVIVSTPGVDAGLVESMVAQVAAAGGGLTGVYEITEQAVDRAEASLVDSLGSQLMTQLADDRIDPAAPTYERLGQLLGVAVATPIKDGRRADAAAQTVRASLSTAGLLTGPGEARLAPLVLVLLPPHAEQEPEVAAAAVAVHAGLATGLRGNAAGAVLLGDTSSGEAGLLASLRGDAEVSSTVSTVDGGDTVVGQVTAMLALIASLEGTVGAFGASGASGAVPIS
ncbi:copper transporter [Nocardioides sp.]|uniref:copper transporter n=1 Tax=Nocardioides sp. TaxID=35761 RepID=UPI001A2BB7E7|nr:copper transporter [Nocardioides sp.]MBJ7359126.1 copper transporter [Nocardioides sp.]